MDRFKSIANTGVTRGSVGLSPFRLWLRADV